MPTISWSDLPKDLLVSIANRLDTRIDVLRVRAVCPLWRSSISPPQKSPPLPLMVPFPVYPTRPNYRCGYFTLSESTIYCLKPPPSEIEHGTGSFHTTGWLLRVKETESGKVQILNLFGDQLPQTSSKVLNLLNFRITEITKAFNLHQEAGAFTFLKVVLSSNPVSTANDYAVLAINYPGQLCYIKLGNDKWSVMTTIYYEDKFEDFIACDILDHKGQFYVVDEDGKVVVLNYSFEVIGILASPNFDNCPANLQFFESLGDLFLVDKQFQWYEDTKSCVTGYTSVHIKVYKFDEEVRKWNEENNLGDRMLFVCQNICFSVSVLDFAGCKGNCIYFINEFSTDVRSANGLSNLPIYVCNLDDDSRGPLLSYPGYYSNIFGSPPAWPSPNQ